LWNYCEHLNCSGFTDYTVVRLVKTGGVCNVVWNKFSLALVPFLLLKVTAEAAPAACRALLYS
jgi:hypothetical protein